MSDGFFARWSRRKLEAAQPVNDVAHEPDAAPVDAAPGQCADADLPGAVTDQAAGTDAALEGGRPVPPTLADVQALGADSDFRRFVAPDVAAPVKNAALKKLFADPRYNVMDGLDVYVDDYARPDPLPSAIARRLADAALRYGAQEDPAALAPAAIPARDVADAAPTPSVAQSGTDPAAPLNADPDLRLQPDDAAEGGGARPGAA